MKLGLTQSELAQLADVSQSLVSQIESGEVDPRLSTLSRIAEALNEHEAAKEICARDLYQKELIYVSGQDSISHAANLMWSKKISQLPVFEDGRNVGSISEKSITAEIARGSAEKIASRKVEEIMQDPFPMVGTNARMDVIVSLLNDNLAVLVMDKGKVVGIITKADVLSRLKSQSDQHPPDINSSR